MNAETLNRGPGPRGDAGAPLAELATPQRRVWSRIGDSRAALFVVSLLGLVALWYVVILVFRVPAYVIPPPHRVAVTMANNVPFLLTNARVTALQILAGFLLAAAVGFPIGVLIAFSRLADRLLYPPLVVSQAVPKVALAPIFLAWFGFGFRTNVAISFLVAVFPVIINTALGLKSLDPAMVRLGRAMGANRSRLFLKIRLPAALPTIFAGLKIAITFAVIGAIVGEFVAGSSGLGYAIASASGSLNMSLAFGAIVAVSALGLIAFYLVELIERFILRHHPEVQRSRREP